MTSRVRLARTLVAALTVAFVCSVSSAAASQPRIRLIATGGTIANHDGGRLSAATLAASVPDLAAVARVEPETFASQASLSLTLDDWLRLSRRLATVLEDEALAGVIVTSGTDTLEELAWFLDLTVADDRPIVITGAMRRPGSPGADGPANILDAARVAAAPQAGARGVLVVFGGLILSAREVQKVSTASLQAFESDGERPLGRVEGGTIRFSRPPERGPHFDLSGVRELPRVDLLWTYQQAPGDLIEAALRNGARGLVIAAAGAGALTAAQSRAIRAAERRGIPVVIASRVEHGKVPPDQVPRLRLVAAAGALSPLKARILLMVALAAGLTPADIAEVFG